MPNLFIDQSGMSDLGQMFRIARDGTHLVVFKIGFQYILAQRVEAHFCWAKMYWNLYSLGFVPLCANLTHFMAKLDTLQHQRNLTRNLKKQKSFKYGFYVKFYIRYGIIWYGQSFVENRFIKKEIKRKRNKQSASLK